MTDPTVDSQVIQLKDSGANVFFNIAIPKFAAQAIRKAADLNWKPVHYLNNVSSSVASTLKPAGSSWLCQPGRDPLAVVRVCLRSLLRSGWAPRLQAFGSRGHRESGLQGGGRQRAGRLVSGWPAVALLSLGRGCEGGRGAEPPLR